MLTATTYRQPVLPMVHFSTVWGYHDGRFIGAAPASAAWESANRAVYMPIWVPTTCVAKRVFWANGTLATGSATVECGLYRDNKFKPGDKHFSASAVQATVSVIQFADITDTTVWPGLWWIGFTSSSVTNTAFMRSSTGTVAASALCRFEEAAANPLPATATPVESSAANMWVAGFSTTTVT